MKSWLQESLIAGSSKKRVALQESGREEMIAIAVASSFSEAFGAKQGRGSSVTLGKNMSTSEVVAEKPKARVGLLAVCLLIAALRGLLHYGAGMRRTGNSSYAIGYAIARAILAPAVIAGLFCIPKKRRNVARFTKAFAITSGAMLLLDFGEIGASLKR